MSSKQPYIATEKIYVGNSLGYAPGDEVHEDVVKALGVEDSVSRADTKAAKDVVKDLPTP